MLPDVVSLLIGVDADDEVVAWGNSKLWCLWDEEVAVDETEAPPKVVATNGIDDDLLCLAFV